MFNLIVAVISIALIAAMAAASIFYGGSAFSSGTAQAAATTLINNGQQISGAQQLYMIDSSGNRATSIAGLDGEYLQAVPTPPAMATGTWDLDAEGLVAAVTLDADEFTSVCAEAVDQGGVEVAAGYDATGVASSVVALGDAQFGCFNDGADPAVVDFVYKL